MTIDQPLAGLAPLAACGKPIQEPMLTEWFAGKAKPDEFNVNKALGCAVTLDHLSRVTAVFLFAARVEGANKPFAGGLPGGLSWSSNRADANAAFGKPESSGEPTNQPAGSVFHSPYPWDRWSIASSGAGPGGLLRIEYSEASDALRSITFQPPPSPEPWSVEFEIFASHYQFVVGDIGQTNDLETIWDDPSATDVQFAPGASGQLVGVGTKRFGTVPVTVSWYPEEPKLDPRGIDRINECGLTIVTSVGVGNYVSDTELKPVDIGPGTYGLRVLYEGQKQVVNDQEGNDRYVVQLWPVVELPPVRYLKPKPKAATKP
jgi:hypothetical protein